MPRNRLLRARPERYSLKAHDVLLSNSAHELSDTPKKDGKYRTQLEIKDEIIGLLKNLVDELGRMARGELEPDPDRWGPRDTARLLQYATDKAYRKAVNRTLPMKLPPEPDFIKAQGIVQDLIDQLSEMDDPDWRKRLKGLLET